MRRLIAFVAGAALAAPATAPATVRLRITTPAPGAYIDAHPHVSSLAAGLVIRGRAQRGATVELRSRCELNTCRTFAVADREGRFKARMDVVLPRGRQNIRIRALYPGGEQDYARSYPLLLPAYAAYPPYVDDAPAPQLAMIGDSLAVGTDAPLRANLYGWKVTTDGRVSRPLAEGMALLDATPLPSRPLALAFSLFTNDDPRAVDALEAAVRKSLDRLGRDDCAIWATIVRPRLGGVSYTAANDRLKALALDVDIAGRLLVIDWAAAVRRNRGWLHKDGVHPTAEGYAARAQLYAGAAEACADDRGW